MTQVIYHADCMDGFGAALCARQFAIQNTDVMGMPEFIPAQYGYGEPPNVKGRRVYIVDFSYKRAVLLDMAKQAHHLVVLDHHKTARDDLTGGEWPANTDIFFDMERSGAGMAWDFFFPEKPRPLFIDMLEDRDLWRFSLPGSRQLHFALQITGFDFEAWATMLADREATIAAVQRGAAYEEHHNWCVSQFVDMAIEAEIGGHRVPVANAPYWFASDTAGKLAEGKPFAGTFFKRDGKVSISLRSRDGLDVAEIAEKYGGGGHRNAAGFQVSALSDIGL